MPESNAAFFAEPLEQFIVEILSPSPGYDAKKLFEFVSGRLRPFLLLGGDDVLNPRER